MAIQQSSVSYSGLTTLPDDAQCQDGALAFATNAVWEDGALKTYPPAAAKGLVVAGGDKVYLHSTASYTHYIIARQSGGSVLLFWVDKDTCEKGTVHWTGGKIATDEDGAEYWKIDENDTNNAVTWIGSYSGTLVDLAMVGNTVVMSTSASILYFIWSNDKSTYKYMGDGVPSVDILWGLSLNMYYEDNSNISDISVNSSETTTSNASDDDYTTIATEEIQWSTSAPRWENAWGGISIEKGAYAYKFKYPRTALVNIDTVTIYGIPEDGGDEEQICSKSTGVYHDAVYSFAATKNYSSLTVVLTPTPNAGITYVGTTIILMKSNKEVFSISVCQLNDSLDNFTALMGYINKFVYQKGKKKDRFIYPFFLRYALKLYDGTYAYPSVPLLLVPNSGYAPVIRYYKLTGNSNYNLDLGAFAADLVYSVKSSIDDIWADVILGVDVFVSTEIYPYDQGWGYEEGKQWATYRAEEDSKDAGVGFVNSTSYSTENVVVSDLLTLVDTYLFDKGNATMYYPLIAQKDDDELESDYTSVASFYKIKSIKFDELKDVYEQSTYVNLDLEKGTLDSLETREAYSEETVEYSSFRNANLFSYNNRLHLFGGTASLPAVTPISSQNGLIELYPCKKYWVKIRTTDGDKAVLCEGNGTNYNLPWFFYPDNRAYELVVMVGNDNECYSYNLTGHDFLNGVYLFNGFDCLTNDEVELNPDNKTDVPTVDDTVNLYNKIYVSEASNPFVFKNAMVCTAGAGQVLALSCAARALSQGQFGQFPLYAFTDEGIWAITVADDGTYSTSQPFARDVARNVSAVTQLDSEVLFMSDRGVMVITGSSVSCLSDSIDGDFGQLNPLDLPRFGEFCGRFLSIGEDELERRVNAWAGQPFLDFIAECGVKQDYVHQRLVMYSPSAGVAYVYSYKSRQWGMMLTDLQDGVNSYPNALALQTADDGCALVDLSEYDKDADPTPMVFVTRPVKLGGPDIMKTLVSLVQRGYMRQDLQENHTLGMVLYGSLDCFHWEIVASTRTHRIDNIEGTPYKYFRLAVAVRLGFRENVRGFDALYDLRGTGKLR